MKEDHHKNITLHQKKIQAVKVLSQKSVAFLFAELYGCP